MMVSLSRRGLVAVAVLSLMTAFASSSARAFALQSASSDTRPLPGSHAKLTGYSWRLISLNGHDLDAKVPKAPQMVLVEQGTRIMGFSGCNRFLATYSLQQDRLSVNSDLQVTKRVCPYSMDVEADFIKVLQTIDSWRIVNGVLELSREQQVLARFK
ncbi:MAG TPA: META domain-containing protein [Acidisarcina sp.]|nr:META domain-containing protein [Acidisarcina sp.]